MTTRRRRASARGVDTSYLEAGEPDHSPVVLVHDGGFGSDAEVSWGPFIEELARDHWVLAPDLIGHGGTEKIYFFDRTPHGQRIDHVAWFCEAVVPGRLAQFVGCSFGGSMVVHAAVASGGSRWPMSSGVSVSGTAGLFKAASQHEWLREFEPTREWMRAMTALLVEDVELHESLVERRYHNALVPGHWEALRASRLRAPGLPIDSERTDVLTALGQCPTPLLFVEATEDPLVERGWAAALADAARAGSHCEVPGRHCPHLDDPGTVADAIRSFNHAAAASAFGDDAAIERC